MTTWRDWEGSYEDYLVCEQLKESIAVLTDALRKISLELLKAGETTPELWHSDNEKQAFKQFTKMGIFGMDAIARSSLK